jgi:hypothetical protein
VLFVFLVDLRVDSVSMASVPGSTNQGTHFPRKPFVFPSFGNVGPPYIENLSLLRLTIGLPMWLFSTPVFPNAASVSNDPSVSNANPPSREFKPPIDPLPSSHVASSSFSSLSPDKILDVSNQVDKKKRKRNIKKKKTQQGGKPPTTVESIEIIEKSTTKHRNLKFPFRLCKGDHLLRDFPGLTKVLEVSSLGPRQSMSSAFGHHAGNKPSTSESNFGENKNRDKFPCSLCEGSH